VSFSETFFSEVAAIARTIDAGKVDAMASAIAALRDQGGRLFVLGVGGGAANCSHAVNDFRKLCGVEAYSPVDNVSELTARTNDEGWETIFSGWLEVSRPTNRDAVLIFSVGGGDRERNVSTNLISAIDFARQVGMKVFGVVGREGGHTAQAGDLVVVVPTVEANRVTPHTEAFQAVVWHCLVSNPILQSKATVW
jgi:D-sedoheptulose 7-phosphate isomerase